MNKTYSILITLLLSVAMCTAQEKQQSNFEDWDNKPEKVVPRENYKAPSDAIVLFDKNLDVWQFTDGSKVSWPASKKGFAVVPGTQSIQTKQKFGNCQVHVEWRLPKNEDQGKTMNWGNSGLKFMERYELQIYNSYNDGHEIYYNGQAASIYKQHKPLVNCCQKPGEWERYDIVFDAPVFASNGSVEIPAFFTVFHNGILVQNHVEVKGTTSHTKYRAYKIHAEKLPLLIQSHGSAVEYRNIWIREL